MILLNIIMILLYRYNSYIYKNYNGRGVSKIMSSLQKFHRRTMSLGTVTWPATSIGMGDATHGYWLGDISTNKLIVAPKSTDFFGEWGSYGTTRGTVSTTNGLANTNTLAGFGQAAHPAAYYCKNLTTGGYNTWYLPAKDELTTLYANKAATPFATANSFDGAYHVSSTEANAANFWERDFATGNQNSSFNNKARSRYARAVRRSTI